MPTIQCGQNKISRPVDQQSLYRSQAGRQATINTSSMKRSHMPIFVSLFENMCHRNVSNIILESDGISYRIKVFWNGKNIK